MNKELDLWRFIDERLKQGQTVMLLVVAESTGSSPGRPGFKMAVSASGELAGSIGGGMMEVRLVEQSRALLAEPAPVATTFPTSAIREQVHQKHSPHASGMICSGKQTVIFKRLDPADAPTVEATIHALGFREATYVSITQSGFLVGMPDAGTRTNDFSFQKITDLDFVYEEKLGKKNDLYIIGGGHCALALSESMSKMDFYVRIFDDRPDLNTLEKNRYADEIMIIDSYDRVGEFIPNSSNVYVVVMTLGYASDEVVIRQLINHDLRYFGVLGSKAKMAALLKELKTEGIAAERLDRIHTPIGVPIGSHTPEEIAVSIAAEIIMVKNS